MVTKATKSALIAKIAAKCMNRKHSSHSASPGPMELGTENTYSAQNRKTPKNSVSTTTSALSIHANGLILPASSPLTGPWTHNRWA